MARLLKFARNKDSKVNPKSETRSTKRIPGQHHGLLACISHRSRQEDRASSGGRASEAEPWDLAERPAAFRAMGFSPWARRLKPAALTRVATEAPAGVLVESRRGARWSAMPSGRRVSSLRSDEGDADAVDSVMQAPRGPTLEFRIGFHASPPIALTGRPRASCKAHALLQSPLAIYCGRLGSFPPGC